MALSVDNNTLTERGVTLSRAAYFPDTFDYALVSSAARTAPVSGSRIRRSVFDIQDDLSELPAAHPDAMVVLQREVEPWSRFDDTVVTDVADLEFTLGFDAKNERFLPLGSPVPALVDAQRDLIECLRGNPGASWACLLSRRSHQWEPPAGAETAVTTVREHMGAAADGDFATLKRLATGPLLAEIEELTDSELAASVRGVYDTVPSVMVLARNDNRPGHHHVLTNSTLHFDVDDSTGTWLIRQVRLMKRIDHCGTLPGLWRSLATPPAPERQQVRNR